MSLADKRTLRAQNRGDPWIPFALALVNAIETCAVGYEQGCVGGAFCHDLDPPMIRGMQWGAGYTEDADYSQC